MAKPSLNDVLAHFREAATSNRDLGDRFERLICRYLELDPIYAERFSHVWMWNEWPRKGGVGDVGIDIVAEERATGEFCAIQCKFYLPEHTIAKEDIDSFFTASGKELFTSCMIVSTTDRWGKNAEHALANQSKPVTRLTVHDLDASPIDWSKFNLQRPQDLNLRPQKKPRDDQKTALADVIKGFVEADRGKLIMACGTGKTFTALKIAEKLAPKGHVLFLVPSLSLMSQTLREWTAESSRPIHSLAVCSDTNIGKRNEKSDDDKGDITTYDLAFPATTSARQIVSQYQAIQRMGEKKKTPVQMTVVFSTYQSIEAVSGAQKAGLPEFDLIICDEAHRTTGVTLTGEDESHFVKVHDAAFIKAKKRLYMTATPRIYGDEAKVKAKDADAEVCSMDDAALFGTEFHRLGFGEAVSKSLLSDYKVLVLAVDEKYVNKAFQRQIADKNNEIDLNDAVRITGCWNGLAKRFDHATASSADLEGDVLHMRRAVAFSRSIKDSKAFVEKFGQIVAAYREAHPDAENLLHCELDHVDGTYDALNVSHDWINQRDPAFEAFVSFGEKRDDAAKTVFEAYSLGVATNRDAWTYNFSRGQLALCVNCLIAFYNTQKAAYEKAVRQSRNKPPAVEDVINTDPKNISWTRSLKEDVRKLKSHSFEGGSIVTSLYRPFCKQQLYFSRQLNEYVYQWPKFFPRPDLGNFVISLTGVGASKLFSAVISDCVPNLHMHDTGQCFPLHLYEKDEPQEGELISYEQEGELVDGYRRRSAITDEILTDFRAAYEARITKEDIFYYVYGVLHSPEYCTRFASDLKKMLPRLPFTRETVDFWRFSQAGRDLVRWHLNYETVEPWPVQEFASELLSDPAKDFLVQKMTFGRKDRQVDKTTIHYNARITLTGIPLEAYDYVVNGKPALEWIMERYQITVDKDSGIRNNPNDWAREHNQPRYILDLVKRIVRVSLETTKIVNALPALNERK